MHIRLLLLRPRHGVRLWLLTRAKQPKADLRKQEDLHFDRFIVSIDYMEAGCVMAVTFDDSNISFFDARSMTPLNMLDDINTVTSIPQAGFIFPTDTSGRVLLAAYGVLYKLTL